MKLLIIGNGGHGKDAVGDILRDHYGLKSISSSMFAAEKAVFPLVSDLYVDAESCYDDRRNHRSLWYHAISAYNLRPGPSLAEQILEHHDIYTGMRSRVEYDKTEILFDVIVWVDARDRLPAEPSDSIDLTAGDADYVIDNNGPEENLKYEVDKFMNFAEDFIEATRPRSI